MKPISFTDYPDANELITLLLANVPGILRDQFVGMYIYGSIASGDFDEHSDIDILVVTETDLSRAEFDVLQEMHETIQELDSPWAIQVEIVYVPRAAIRRFDPENNQYPHLDRGPGEKLHIVQHSSDWVVQRYLLRERGITLTGPDPKTLIDPVSADDLRKAMVPLLFDWYGHFDERSRPFGSRGYQSYVVLSLCRILYTIQTGDVVSKLAAARWAREALDPRWVPLVESAIYGRQHPNEEPLPEDVVETLNMIQYAMQRAKPTPYPDVNELLNLLLANVKEILGDQFVGMYLHGSLANGGFDEYSDIDVIFVTDGSISEETFEALQKLHEMIAVIDSPWRDQLEVSYIPKEALRRFDPFNNKHPLLERGTGQKLRIMPHESDWVVERYIARERGITVIGPDPKTLIDPVSGDDMRKAVGSGMPLWLNPILADPSEINRRGYQSFFVLSLCRMLYTLKHGDVLSKPAAADWAMATLDHRWTPLIERALMGRQNSNLDAKPEDILGTLDMMRFTLQQIKPTPYREVNEILNLLLISVQGILKNQFVGMYLYGSLSTGDFNPEASDIDFLVVTTSTLSNKTIAELESMHQQIWESGNTWASKLEGSYIPKREIRRHDPLSQPCPTVNEDKFFLDKRGSDWIIQRHVIREQGVILAGPDPKTLIDPVDPKNIRRAVKGVLNEWWFPMIEDPTWLREHGSEYHAYAILTMCRALYTLENGTIVSKPTAARWVQGKLGENWSQVIEQAIDAQKHGAEHAGLFNNALQLIRITKEMATS